MPTMTHETWLLLFAIALAFAGFSGVMSALSRIANTLDEINTRQKEEANVREYWKNNPYTEEDEYDSLCENTSNPPLPPGYLRRVSRGGY